MTDQNPALEPEAPEPEMQVYEVTGGAAVLGHEPGSVFEAILPPEQEAMFLEYGHLTKVEEAKTPEAEGSPEPEPEEEGTK